MVFIRGAGESQQEPRLTQAAGLVVSASGDSALCVWRLRDGACLRRLTGPTTGAGGLRVVVDVGGGRVASGGLDGALRVWDVLSGVQVRQLPTRGGSVWCAAALGSSIVATGQTSVMGEIRLWSLLPGAEAGVGVLRGHTGTVCLLTVVPPVGGSEQARVQPLLASGSDDRSVRLWDVDAGTCTAVLKGHTHWLRCLADLGGGLLLSVSADRTLRVWDTATGACLSEMQNAHGGVQAIRAACAILGGAATGSFGGAVQRWKWDAGARLLRPEGEALRLDGGLAACALVTAPAARPDGPEERLLVGCGSRGGVGNGAGILVLGGSGEQEALLHQPQFAPAAAAPHSPQQHLAVILGIAVLSE